MTRRVLVHDFSGHPFQVQLSRELARRGDEVLHLHCSSYVSGKGATSPRPDDPDSFAVEALDLGEPFNRYSFRERRLQEATYAQLAIDRIRRFAPDVLISCNVPLFAHATIQRWAQSDRIRFVFWHQDFYGSAMREQTARLVPIVGDVGGRWFERMERQLLGSSDAVIGISHDFARRYRQWGLDGDAATVIENWAPLDELPLVDRRNDWAERHGLADTVNLLYSGTLGLKHNPQMLAALAKTFEGDERVRVVVVSEGSGADWLADAKRRDSLDRLVLLPFQPYDELPSVIATGDVLLAILEPGASSFSVPSKVLSYLCAGRPVLAGMPHDNLAAETIVAAGAGSVVDVGDIDGFTEAARALVADPELRSEHGRAARRYAEQAFDISSIADRFDTIIDRVHGTQRWTPTPPSHRSTS